ncbi:MAG TPA: efflux RND transporter permease subunit, partial [Candidatus Obscuribacterales bacterium]
GFSFAGNKPSNGILFSNLKPWSHRKRADQNLGSIINKLRGPLSQITEATVIPFNPPAIEGLGSFGGFVFELQDLAGTDIDQLAQVTQKICAKANQTPELRGVFSTFAANSPQLVVNVDRDRAKSLNVSLTDLFSTLQTYLGSYYVNDIDIGTRVYRVYVQADAKYRANPKDIKQFYVMSANGDLIPLSNLVTLKTISAPQNITHYDLFRSTEINGSAAPGYSSGQAMQAMERIAEQVMPAGMAYKWSGISLEQLESGSKAIILFTLGLIFVFLVLAAQYESFTDPLIILISVPTALFGAMLAQHLRGLENDVFCQIGLVMLIGLVCKNAILIVEFANQLKATGLPAPEAVIRAATIRLRPIMMTTFAFVMGILPLVFATGAGANARHSLGTAVCGGMIGSSILTLFIVPVVYVLMDSITGIFGRKGRRHPEQVDEDIVVSESHAG